MIHHLTIKNFKSIRELSFDCSKMNIFIGEPNSGKSNIIEALALQSQNATWGNSLNTEIFRYRTISDLFYDFDLSNFVEVDTGVKKTVLSYTNDQGIPDHQFSLWHDFNNQKELFDLLDHSGRITKPADKFATDVKYYMFRRHEGFSSRVPGSLQAPEGKNIPSLIISNPEMKKWVSEFLRSKELNLTIKPAENEILVSKLVENEIYSYSWFSLSETLQRVIFYNLAIKSNQNSVLLLDEPDSNTFPFYTKYLAERFALDSTNQFFISTHNPYLLLSLVEKSKMDDIRIFITKMEGFLTRITLLSKNQVKDLLDLNTDLFFNFDKILEG